MVIGIRSLALALMLAGGLSAPASAEVFTFDQTSFEGTDFSGPPATIHFTIVTDGGAFAVSQYSLQGCEPCGIASTRGTVLTLAGTGVESVNFQDVSSSYNGGPWGFAPIPLPYGSPTSWDWIVSLTGDATGIESGYLYYFGIYDDFNVTIDHGAVTGTFDSDNPYIAGCFVQPGCTFGGVMVASGLPGVVPEPASLGLLASGLAGLLLITSRRRPDAGGASFRHRGAAAN